VLSVLALDYFFVPPRLRLVVDDPRYLLTFAGLLIVGLVISTLAAQAHAQIEASRRRQAETAALCSLSQALVAAEGLEAALQAVISHVRVTFGCAAAVLMPRGEALTTRAASPDLILREDELAVATWAFEQGQPAGEGTDNLPSGALRWLPLKTAGGVVGVLGVKVPARDSQLTPDQRRLLETFANYAALAIERA
jgi:two-component system sensor histidine kinase KdpD